LIAAGKLQDNSDPSGPENPVNSCIFVAVLYNNNNNNDRLTAFDPGQPG